MERISFDKVLFKTAFAVMACDGDIHNDEIDTFRNISKSNPYFLNFDFETELDIALKEIKSQGMLYITNFIDILKSHELKEKQKLLLIEVILKMIDADKKADDNELKFLNSITNILKLSDELLILKFPTYLNYLLNKSNYSSDINIKIKVNNIKGILK